jgi:predicted glycosyltransferase
LKQDKERREEEQWNIWSENSYMVATAGGGNDGTKLEHWV